MKRIWRTLSSLTRMTPKPIFRGFATGSAALLLFQYSNLSSRTRELPRLDAEIPLAFAQLKELHRKVPSLELKSYLDSFTQERILSIETFKQGIEDFIRIANLTPSERIQFYGTPFGGLHYTNDLVDLWNNSSSEKVSAAKLTVSPTPWNYTNHADGPAYVYKGNKPSEALDKLIQGPSVIDCGMFCQLSIWFGIRHMLGNDLFNELFGHNTLYLTQRIYDPITNPNKPNAGNPLYDFFESVNFEEVAQSLIKSGVYCSNVENHPLYHYKHPEGDAGSHNCIVIDGKYSIFDPRQPKTSNLSRRTVQRLLLKDFNNPQTVHDNDVINLYKNKDPKCIDPRSGDTYEELLKSAEIYANLTIELKDLEHSPQPLGNVRFDFKNFCEWVNLMRSRQTVPVKDTEASFQQSFPAIPHAVLEQIPYENREAMSFSFYKTDSSLHLQLYSQAIKFCKDVEANKSSCVILTGKAGVGKTAAAVCCFKYLLSKKKKVLWMSETMIHNWMNKAENEAELLACREKIITLLNTNPDAVILDDDNLSGYGGKVILEEVNRWYHTQAGKGLFITSNQPVVFDDCYGFRFESGSYEYPPFSGYRSSQYQNRFVLSDLNAPTMRKQAIVHKFGASDTEKLDSLMSYSGPGFGNSVGIIVNADTFEANKRLFPKIEYIPDFIESELVVLRRELSPNGKPGPKYNALDPLHKKWLHVFYISEFCLDEDRGKSKLVPAGYGIAPNIFQETQHNYIAIEVSDSIGCHSYTMDQILSVVNYAFDKGSKKVILINNTKLTPNEFIENIQENIPEKERERTMARMVALGLMEPERSISAPSSSSRFRS